MLTDNNHDIDITLPTIVEQTGLLAAKILGSLAGCRTKFLFAVFCKIGALERNAY